MSSPSAATSDVVPTSNVVPTSVATSNAVPSTSAAVPSSASQPATSQQPTSAAPTTSAAQPTTSASSQAPSSSAQPSTSQAPTSSAQPSTSNPPTSAPSSSAAASSSAPASSQAPVTSSAAPSTFVTTIVPTDGGSTQTSVVVVTSTINGGTGSTTSSTSSSTSNPSLTPGDSSGSGSSGLKTDAKVAIGVVVPIVGIALIAIAALFFWRKRKARLAAEEERRKEVEDYSYNPNADPTIPGVVDGGYEMNEDTSGGYRGWGTTTLASSNGRKASTTLSGGKNAYSDPSSPTQAPIGVARSDNIYSPDGEILGAMNGNTGNNRAVGVDRGPSNASSSYSAANRSDGSDLQGGVSYGQGATYYDVQDQEPYTDGHYHDAPPQPVIRDNPARRNTRIENTSHYPQQSAGISQNF
ncbi:hypothetical protein V2G26_001279 [Clonostachys chloroleuca]